MLTGISPPRISGAVNDYAAQRLMTRSLFSLTVRRYGGGGVYNYYSAVTADHQFTPQVLTHEFGHGFAGLADEYYHPRWLMKSFIPWMLSRGSPISPPGSISNAKWKDMIAKSVPVPTPNDKRYTVLQVSLKAAAMPQREYTVPLSTAA